MKKINLYSLKGTKLGEISLPKFFEEEFNLKLLAQAIRVYSDRLHIGHAKTKTRSEIARTKKKWYRQKGTGGARHGAKSAPIFVGGGVAHGPKTGKSELTLPIKIRRKALAASLSLKAKEDKILAVRGLPEASKTSQAQELIDKLYPPSQKILSKVEGMNAKQFLLRRDFAPDEARGEDTPAVRPRELHPKKEVSKRPKVSFVLKESGKAIARGLGNLKDSQVFAYKDLNAFNVYFGGDLIMDEGIFTKPETEGKKEAKLKSKSGKKSKPIKKDITGKKVLRK